MRWRARRRAKNAAEKAHGMSKVGPMVSEESFLAPWLDGGAPE